MPKRRRLLTTPIMKHKSKVNYTKEEDDAKAEVSTPRGRLKGALMDALETADDSETSSELTPTKHDGVGQDDSRDYSSEEESHQRGASPPRQSYVLKLFDRSVDLSQFEEDSPLYPICRAWIANQPKANYKKFGKRNVKPIDWSEDSIELPGPSGPPVTRVPPLLPGQAARSKDNINLNYREAPPPSRQQLLSRHAARWAAVRRNWLRQAASVEQRYEDTQRVLNSIVVNGF